MSPQVIKEFRLLRSPWALALIAGTMLPLKPFVGLLWNNDIESILSDTTWWIFLGGLAMLAAISFGTEVHERTLSLLLSQPVSRARLWRQKMLTLGAAFATAAGSFLILNTLLNGSPIFNGLGVPTYDALFTMLFILATLCSAGFWTLTAGSTIGGVVFTISSQFLFGLGVNILVWYFLGKEQGLERFDEANLGMGTRAFLVFVIAGVTYSMLFLYLSRRKFLGLELKDISVGNGLVGSETSVQPKWYLAWLVCDPHQRLRNLVRKELRLQKPLFLIAGVFVLG